LKKDRFSRIKDILFEVSDLPPDKRKAYLDESCKDDPELRQEVEALLALDDDRLELLKTGGALQFDPEYLSTPADMVGKTISHFQIEEEIAVGGMGVLYRAFDTRLHRHVAIKVLRAGLLNDPVSRERFIREARAASALNHPGIVTVYDIGEDSGIDYIVMEYVEGNTLDEVIPVDGLPFKTVTSYALAMSEALVIAHDNGIVHRDLKPSNIMITEEGNIKILDFGIAKWLGEVPGEGTRVSADTGITEEGSTIGTLGYMSPEQVEGRDIDFRSDIFSLGVVFYKMITGKSPFSRDTTAVTIHAVVYDDPEPLEKYREDAPEELQRVVNRMLAKDREDRYQATLELVDDLRSFHKGHDVQHAPPVTDKRTKVKSLAILYLRNLGSEDDEYLSYGITEDLIVDMTRIGTLRVAPMRSILKHKDSDEDLEEIAKKLDVKLILDGSIHRTESSVRISAQLVDVETGKNLWANRWEELSDNLPEVKQSLAQGINRALEVGTTAVKAAQAGKPEAQDPRAYEYYLRGKYTFDRKKDDADIEVALGLYRQALSLEPSLLAAQAGIAELLIGKSEYEEANKVLSLALADSRKRGLMADEAVILRLYARSLNFLSYWDKALEYEEKALDIMKELNDLAGEAEVLGDLIFTLTKRSRFAEALVFSKRALDIHRNLEDKSKSAWGLRKMGSLYLQMGDYDRSLALAEDALEFARKRGDLPLEEACTTDIGIIYEYTGNHDEALSQFEQSLRIATKLGNQDGRASSFGCIGMVHLSKGNYRKALEVFNKSSIINKEIGERSSVALSLDNIALIHNILGEYDLTIKTAREALAIAEELDYPLIVAAANQTLGETHFYKGDYETALEYCLIALKICNQSGLRRDLTWCHASLCELYYHQKGYDLCREHAGKAQVIAKEIGEKEPWLKASAYLAFLMVHEGQFQAGIKRLREIVEESESHGDPRFILNARRLLGQTLMGYGHDDKDREEGRTVLKEALDMARSKEVAYELKWIGDILASV
jgi:non-specific serine/threonine protein kinase